MVLSTLSESVKGNCIYFANMSQFTLNPVKAPSHFALVDSRASIHILTCHTFLSVAFVNHLQTSAGMRACRRGALREACAMV